MGQGALIQVSSWKGRWYQKEEHPAPGSRESGEKERWSMWNHTGRTQLCIATTLGCTGRQDVTMEGGGKAAETAVATFIALSDGREPHQTFLPGLKGATSQSNEAGKGASGKTVLPNPAGFLAPALYLYTDHVSRWLLPPWSSRFLTPLCFRH